MIRRFFFVREYRNWPIKLSLFYIVSAYLPFNAHTLIKL